MSCGWLAGLAVAGCLLAPPGCATPAEASSDEVPSWIQDVPHDDEYLYAVEGYVGALYPEDNQAHAMSRARDSLGRSLRSRVRGSTLLSETHASTHWESTVLVDADTVLEHSELMDQWTDREGVISKRGTVWVLMRVPRSL